jgi:hypothetical protein
MQMESGIYRNIQFIHGTLLWLLKRGRCATAGISAIAATSQQTVGADRTVLAAARRQRTSARLADGRERLFYVLDDCVSMPNALRGNSRL